ncbi:hypothetical protein BCR34DRAFT_368803 [Clohesyomyces aquaticus]|uniref:Rhodopsin domain-containing protein n=1 Tax=Clohesyomyces aquaticus TaxID=1231657 RepID=A0A1Y1ZH84_9PLEO|nr:hypothetical protein BCR34DRAFT_368803 [Clohesyomyces aquaticus]
MCRPDHESEIPYYRHIFERRIAYIFAAFFTRCSILAYYLRIFPPGISTLRRICWVFLALAIAQTTEVLTVLLVLCRSISKLWSPLWPTFHESKCFSSPIYSYSAAIGDSILDTLIFSLPIPYIFSLSKLRARQRLGLILIFALGFVVCVVALLQIPFIRRRTDNSTYFGHAINLLIAIQISLAIVAASLPDLRALIARSFPNFSPLHHRSLATANANARVVNGEVDVEPGLSGEGGGDGARPGFEARRTFRKPDWMRSTLPESLMSTRITREETRQEIVGVEEVMAPRSSRES